MRRSRGKDFGALLPRQTEAPKSPSFSGDRQRRENRVQSRLGIWGSDMSPPPQWTPGRSPGQKRILAYTGIEGHVTSFLHLYAEYWAGWQDRVLGANCPSPAQRKTAPVFYDPITSPAASAP